MAHREMGKGTGGGVFRLVLPARRTQKKLEMCSLHSLHLLHVANKRGRQCDHRRGVGGVYHI